MKNALSTAGTEPFRQRLIALKGYLKGEDTGKELADLSESAMRSADPMDASSLNEFADVLGTISQNSGDALVEIWKALERIEKGTYGACEECEGRIPKTRLEVLPHAANCIECRPLPQATSSMRLSKPGFR